MNHARPLQQLPTTLDRLRQTALDLFSVHGYQSTSLRDLAAHLGVQAGSIYNYIENKQSLLFELIEEVLDDLLAETRLSLKSGGTMQVRLRHFVQAFVVFQAREKKGLILADREAINLSYEQRQRIAALRDEYVQCLRSVISAEMSGGDYPIRMMPGLTNAIIGMLQGLLFWDERDPVLAHEEVVDLLTSMINGAITAALHPGWPETEGGRINPRGDSQTLSCKQGAREGWRWPG